MNLSDEAADAWATALEILFPECFDGSEQLALPPKDDEEPPAA